MLRLSKKVDYAIVTLIHLQATQIPASARFIANQYHLSIQMLANVLKALAATGILSSKRGVAGGYTLGKEADQIFIGDVINAIDGPFYLSDCSDLSSGCKAESSCPAKLPMMMINNKIKDFMSNLALKDIVNKELLQNFEVNSYSQQPCT